MASPPSPSASPILPDAAEDEYNRGSSRSQSEPGTLDDAGDDENNRDSSRSTPEPPNLDDAGNEENRGSSRSTSEPPNRDDAGDDENNGDSSRSTSEPPSLQHAAADDLEPEDECPICFELLFDPLTTHCQHTFCRICLEDMLSKREEPAEQEGPPLRPESLYWFQSRG
ncbi:hypothetical protein DL770_004091 [Monosporascus sp. CRB-9-2]|nr:hypothetical protein DL770_004091 [Monosporascus sp. CRB-9-2]